MQSTDRATLQGFVKKQTIIFAHVFTDEAAAYQGITRHHQSVKHSAGEYVRDMVHTNGMESFWSVLKRGYIGVYHWMSVKHLGRYVSEFSGRHNIRPMDTLDQMAAMAQGSVGKRLTYATLIGDARAVQANQV